MEEYKVELAQNVLKKAGVTKDMTEVASLVAEVVDEDSPHRGFSSMTNKDCDLLYKYAYALVNINQSTLCSLIPDAIIPGSFLPGLQISRMVNARSLEVGTRKIINIFMDNAVFIARQVFNEPRLLVDHEQEVEPTAIPELSCTVNGPLDYVTARAAGIIEMGTYQDKSAPTYHRLSHVRAGWRSRGH